MKMNRFLPLLLICSTSLLPLTVLGETNLNAQSADRVDRLERDVQLLQRQLAQGGAATPATSGDINAPAGGPAQLEVRLSAIEDQLRSLRGQTEENDNRLRKLSDNMDKLQHDIDFRFNEIGAGSHATATPQPSGKPESPAIKPLIDKQAPSAGMPGQVHESGKLDIKVEDKSTGQPTETRTTPVENKPAETQKAPEDKVVADNKTDAPAEKQPVPDFKTPREHYNYAFKLLNQTQYEDAAAAFEAFAKKYPKDPLVGNAFYWEGETYYIRHDYSIAADDFRQGFEAAPEGPKAADNLLKLALSLDALNRDKEACIVLHQIIGKFKKSSSSTASKAESEQKRLKCHID